MNDIVKEIFEKHGIGTRFYDRNVLESINNAIIDICELQKEECTTNRKLTEETVDYILDCKNIAK